MALKKNPRTHSLLIAAIVLAVYVLGTLLLVRTGQASNVFWLSILGLVLFVSTFIVVHSLFLDFVEKRIAPIYKSIQNIAVSRKQIRKKIDNEDIASSLDKEVSRWADDQNKEIRQLKEMEKYRKDFLGNVSHELKTPIFNIQGYILTLLDGGIDDENINTLYLKRAEKSINRMISIVDDLVSISRLESGEFKLHTEIFNIVKLVEEVFESHDMLAKKFKVKLEFDASYNKAIKVRADRKRITEVLNNLIVNSINYGRTNGKTRIGFEHDGDTVMVEITDNGIGISESDLPRIFERFYRVDKSRSRDFGGTGLGLAIVKHIIQAHNQAISVRSVPGRGTTFIFSLEKA